MISSKAVLAIAALFALVSLCQSQYGSLDGLPQLRPSPRPRPIPIRPGGLQPFPGYGIPEAPAPLPKPVYVEERPPQPDYVAPPIRPLVRPYELPEPVAPQPQPDYDVKPQKPDEQYKPDTSAPENFPSGAFERPEFVPKDEDDSEYSEYGPSQAVPLPRPVGDYAPPPPPVDSYGPPPSLPTKPDNYAPELPKPVDDGYGQPAPLPPKPVDDGYGQPAPLPPKPVDTYQPPPPKPVESYVPEYVSVPKPIDDGYGQPAQPKPVDTYQPQPQPFVPEYKPEPAPPAYVPEQPKPVETYQPEPPKIPVKPFDSYAPEEPIPDYKPEPAPKPVDSYTPPNPYVPEQPAPSGYDVPEKPVAAYPPPSRGYGEPEVRPPSPGYSEVPTKPVDDGYGQPAQPKPVDTYQPQPRPIVPEYKPEPYVPEKPALKPVNPYGPVDEPSYDENEESEGPEGCICVPYYQCEDGNIVTDGAGIIDPRSKKPPAKEIPLEAKFIPPYCGTFHVCCSDPETVTQQPYIPKCGVRNPSGINRRVLSPYGKGEADFGEWPWQAAVLKNENEQNLFQCGGTIIDDHHVLTVAHCVQAFIPSAYNPYPNKLKVRLGEWDTQNTKEFLPHEDYDVVRVAIHPGFRNQSLWNDLALLTLDRKVVFKPNIDTVCLPDPSEVFDGQDCVTTGWGKNAYKGGSYSNILKETNLAVVSRPDCQKSLRKTRLGPRFRLHHSFMCAGGEAGRDSCKGDGGGPLVCYRKDGTYALAGLVAWGIDCGQPGVPGVYVKVQQFLPWISQQTGINPEGYRPASSGYLEPAKVDLKPPTQRIPVEQPSSGY